MKKFLLVMPLALLFPIAAHAAWYNPLTWFHEPVREEISTTTQEARPEIKVVEIASPAKVVEKVVPVDRIVEKVVTSTIENPKTLALVEQLYKENQDLKSNVTNLTSTVLNLNDTVNRYVAVINQLQSQLQALGQTTSVPETTNTSNPYPNARIEANVMAATYAPGFSSVPQSKDISEVSILQAAQDASQDNPSITFRIRAYEGHGQTSDSSESIHVETSDPSGFFVYGLPGELKTFTSYDVKDTQLSYTPKVPGDYTITLSSAKYGVSKTVTIHVVPRN